MREPRWTESYYWRRNRPMNPFGVITMLVLALLVMRTIISFSPDFIRYWRLHEM